MSDQFPYTLSREDALFFASCEIQNKTLHRLLSAFGSRERLLQLPKTAFASWRSGEKLYEQLHDNMLARKAENLSSLMDHHGIQLLSYNTANYPTLLREIIDPPISLFCLGNTSLLSNKPILAIVGSRNSSPYATSFLEQIIPQLVASGVTILSGMAFGVDSIAHGLALKHHGTTIAVLGSGLLATQLAHNHELFHDMQHYGLLISEYHPHAEARRYTFPLRNRIIAGMSRAVLVIEAGEKSGALITASCALELGRDVMAVPGDVTRTTSRGTNQLIKDGAHLIQNAEDILELLCVTPAANAAPAAKPSPVFGSKEEATVFHTLNKQELSFDDLIRTLPASPSTLNTMLTNLLLKGYIRETDSHTYAINI